MARILLLWFCIILDKKSYIKSTSTTPNISKTHPIPTNPSQQEQAKAEEEDEERYSRQLYTLGNRAQKLIRSCNVVLDGPSTSGLVYECGKNLVLSGIGSITILCDERLDNDEEEECIELSYKSVLDDLGNVYQKYAQSDLSPGGGGVSSDRNELLLRDYLQKLNPSCHITLLPRDQFSSLTTTDTNMVYLSIDRPESLQASMNEKCHLATSTPSKRSIPFVSTETNSFFGRIGNDFGTDFKVVDVDGTVPKVHLLRHISSSCSNDSEEDEDDANLFVLESMEEDSLTDISYNDVIELKCETDEEKEQIYSFHVEKMISPTSFLAKYITPDPLNKISSTTLLKDIMNTKLKEISLTKQKIPFDISFKPYKEALSLSNHKVTNSPLDNKLRESILMICFQVLDAFIQQYHHPIQSTKDVDIFFSMAEDLITPLLEQHQQQQTKSKRKKKKLLDWNTIVRKFATYSSYKFTPIQALFGAIASQEVIKAATGLYIPIEQIWLYDVLDDFISFLPEQHEFLPLEQKGSSHVQILGKEITDRINDQHVFIVGCGAIGCEVLKNLSSMLSHSKRKGKIIVTDMDTIEKSNLSRQLLFRDIHVGEYKSTVASMALKQYNPNLEIECHTSKIAASEESNPPFHDLFWSSNVNVVMNALDNMETRFYIDTKCVEHTIPLIDAGTLGSKGNVQVVIPYSSESYGSSVDPPDEPSIPLCTLKHFPYEIAHTIQWARDLFEGLFTRRPCTLNEYKDDLFKGGGRHLAKILIQKLGEEEAFVIANELVQDYKFVQSFSTSPSDKKEIIKRYCINWSIQLLYQKYHLSIKELRMKHPPTSLDDDTGEPFWSNTKKLPHLITFSPSSEKNNNNSKQKQQQQEMINQHMIELVQTSSKLRMELYSSANGVSDSEEDGWNQSMEVMLSDKEVSIAIEEYQSAFLDETTMGNTSSSGEKDYEIDPIDKITLLLNQIKIQETTTTISSSDKQTSLLAPIEFEKDNDKNNHVSFITSASNLRAIIYNIQPVPFQETRRIAGQIVPAMITTTSLVSALSCMEFIKLVASGAAAASSSTSAKNVNLNIFKNAFCNLALNFYAFSIPLECEERDGLFDQTYTLWDKITVKERVKEKKGITLRQFLKRIHKKVLTNHNSNNTEEKEENDAWEVSTVSYGPYMIYANFLQMEEDDILDESIWNIVLDAIMESSNDVDFDFVDDNNDAEEKEISSKNNIRKEEEDVTLDIALVENKNILDFTVVVENRITEEEIELPIVRLVKLEEKTQNENNE